MKAALIVRAAFLFLAGQMRFPYVVYVEEQNEER